MKKRIIILITVFIFFSENINASFRYIKNEQDLNKAIVKDVLLLENDVTIRFATDFFLDKSKLKLLLDKIINENGDLRNILKGYSYKPIFINNKIGAIKLNFNYLETKEQYNYVERFIKENINDIIKDADTDIEKVFKINEWIRNNVSYDNTYLKYSSYNALNDKSAVCNGYAMLFNRMVTAAGVESVVVIGNSQEKFHAWNAVKFEGKWYFVDVTLNDSIYSNEYLFLGLKDISKTHTVKTKLPQPVSEVSFLEEEINKVKEEKSLRAYNLINRIYGGEYCFNKDSLYNAVLKALITDEPVTIIGNYIDIYKNLQEVLQEISEYYNIMERDLRFLTDIKVNSDENLAKVNIKIKGQLMSNKKQPSFRNLLLYDTSE